MSLVIPLPFQSLTWNLKMAPWNRRFLLETIMIRFHSFNSGSVLEIHFRTLPPQPLLRPLSGFKSATDRFAVLVRLPSRQFDIEKKGLSWCQKPSIDLTEFSECFFFFFWFGLLKCYTTHRIINVFFLTYLFSSIFLTLQIL